MAIEVDESELPILIVRFVGTSSDAEFERYLATMSVMLAEPGKVSVTVLDATRTRYTTAHQRRMQVDWLAKNDERLRRQSLGTAFVISSAVLRGALTAVFWVQPIRGDYVLVGTLDEARAWARAKLGALRSG